jgi:hypothetical protein
MPFALALTVTLAGFGVTGGGGIGAPPEDAPDEAGSHKAAAHVARRTVRDWGKRRITNLDLRCSPTG